MATYLELRNLFNDGDLKYKVDVSLAVSAESLLAGTPTDADKLWSNAVRAGGSGENGKALTAVITANKAASVAAIQGASDATIQAQVDAVVPDLVEAFALSGGV